MWKPLNEETRIFPTSMCWMRLYIAKGWAVREYEIRCRFDLSVEWVDKVKKRYPGHVIKVIGRVLSS